MEKRLFLVYTTLFYLTFLLVSPCIYIYITLRGQGKSNHEELLMRGQRTEDQYLFL